MRDKWNDITSFDRPIYHTTIGEATNFCLNPEQPAESESTKPSAKKSSDLFHYDYKDIILYNISLGVSTLDLSNLKFLNENDEKFCSLPGYAVIPAFSVLYDTIAATKLDKIQLDPGKTLHGEHYLELFKPLKTSISGE